MYASHVVLLCSGGKLGDQILLIFLWVSSIIGRRMVEVEQGEGRMCRRYEGWSVDHWKTGVCKNMNLDLWRHSPGLAVATVTTAERSTQALRVGSFYACQWAHILIFNRYINKLYFYLRHQHGKAEKSTTMSDTTAKPPKKKNLNAPREKRSNSCSKGTPRRY